MKLPARRLALLLFAALCGGSTLPSSQAAPPERVRPGPPRAQILAPPPPTPPAPPAQRVVASSGDLETITLEDALTRAFEHNLDAKIDKVDIRIEGARVSFASGVFDPAFTFSASHESVQRPDSTANLTQADSLLQRAQLIAIQQNTQAIERATGQPITPITTASAGQVAVFDQDADRFESGLQFRTPLGTRFQFTARQSRIRSTFAQDNRDITPFYTAFGGIEVRQPLLRDFGTDAALSDIRIARVNARVADLAYQRRLSSVAQEVMSTYIDMLADMADLALKLEAIAADEQLVSQNQRRVDVGFMSPFDVQQARAAVSQDQEALILSKNSFMERQFALKRLVLDDYKSSDTQVFVPVTIPDLVVPKLDRSTLLATAFEKRMDYRSAITLAEVQEIRLKFAKNQELPQLDVVGTYGYNGLAFDYSTAREKAYHSQAPELSIGVQLSIPFWNTEGRSQTAAVRGFREQAILRIKQTEQTVSIDVSTVISRIEALQQRLVTAGQTVELNEQAVRIAARRLEEGQVSSFDIIEIRRRLYDAKSRELAARAELNKAITQLWLATGTMLEQTGITLKPPAGK